MKKLCVFFNLPYKGEKLKQAKKKFESIVAGAEASGADVEFLLSICSDTYNINLEFGEILKKGIKVIETSWEAAAKSEVEVSLGFLQRSKKLYCDEYIIPVDNMKSFVDCDYWLFMSDKTELPVAPLVPYGILSDGFIERYSATDEDSIHAIHNLREADMVYVSDPFTKDDVVQYAGIKKVKVTVMPLSFDIVSDVAAAEKNNYALLLLGSESDEERKHFFHALERYYKVLGGELKVKAYFNADATEPEDDTSEGDELVENAVDHYKDYISKNGYLKDKVEVSEHISESVLETLISGAKFMIYPLSFSNDLDIVVKAVCCQTPVFSRNFPHLRYMSDNMKLNICFRELRDIKKIAEGLKTFENDIESVRSGLPPVSDLKKFDIEELGQEMWNLIGRQI